MNDSIQICLAKTRSGGLCQRAGSPKNGRCHLHGGASTGPRTEEGRARIAAAQFKHGRRSTAFAEAQRARNAKGRAIKHELKSIEAAAIHEGLLPEGWQKAFDTFP
jgi:hypothetical protein